jgi:hypothetical protein
MRYKHTRRSAFDEQIKNDLMRYTIESQIGRKLKKVKNFLRKLTGIRRQGNGRIPAKPVSFRHEADSVTALTKGISTWNVIFAITINSC